MLNTYSIVERHGKKTKTNFNEPPHVELKKHAHGEKKPHLLSISKKSIIISIMPVHRTRLYIDFFFFSPSASIFSGSRLVCAQLYRLLFTNKFYESMRCFQRSVCIVVVVGSFLFSVYLIWSLYGSYRLGMARAMKAFHKSRKIFTYHSK